MELTLYNNNIMKDLFDAISTIVDEVSLECDSEGMRLRALDRSHISFVGMDLKSSLFDEYNCETPEKINIDTSELMKILKRCKSNDLLKIETNEGNLRLTFEGDSTRQFSLRLIDISYESPQPPTINPPVTLKIPVEILNDFLKDMSIFGETITFIVDEDYLKCNGENEFGDTEVKYLHGENINEVVQSTFNIAKIQDMLRAKKLNKEIILKLGLDTPLLLSFEIGMNDGELEFLLAPRLQEDADEY